MLDQVSGQFSTFHFSLLAMAFDEGVLLLHFVGLEDMVDVKEDVGAESEEIEVRSCVAARRGFEITDRQTILTFLVEGDRTFIVLSFGALGSRFGDSFVRVMGVNQSAYSRSRILGEMVKRCR